jgi:probable HAF family extracellular repeat protein
VLGFHRLSSSRRFLIPVDQNGSRKLGKQFDMASPNNTIVTSPGAVITDALGNHWAMRNGQVIVNGVADLSTANVLILAYENGMVWQMNNDRLWWSKSSPSAAWGPAFGTTVSPLMGIAAADNTVIASSHSAAVTDANGDHWTITASGQVAVNGIIDRTTARVVALAYEKNIIWQENADGLWWSKINSAAQWSPPFGSSTSPVPTGSLQIMSFDLPAQAPNGLRQILQTAKINDQGDVVGTASLLTPVGKSAGSISFSHRGGASTQTMPAGFDASGINDAGQIVGYEGILNSSGGVNPVSAPGSATVVVRGENNQTQLIGTYLSAGSAHGFIDTNGVFTNVDAPLSLGSTSPEAVNDLGQIVGTFSDTVGEHGFLYANGKYTVIDIANTIFVHPTGITDAGEIVGTYIKAVGTKAIDHGFIDIGGTVQTFDIAGSTQTSITGVNNRGQLVGWSDDLAGRHAFVATPTA